MLTLLVKLFKVLNSEQSPAQIAAAISLAAIFGLTPLISLHNLLVLFVVLFFRVNLTFFLLAWPLFTGLGVLITPLSEELGFKLLQAPELIPFWQDFYNTLVGRWSNFYYSNLIGSLAIAVAFAILSFPINTWLVRLYREKWLQKFEQYQFVRLLKASKFWQLYESYSAR
jgi:uncharacterized protein (TIGR03546 family)